MATYAVLKPFGMLSQFTPEAGHPGLSELGEFPKDVYPIGRLDRDSEGLLLLTNDNDLKRRILEGQDGRKIWKTYHVQIEGAPTEEDLRAFERPMQLKAKGKIFTTRPAKARLLPADYAPPWERTPLSLVVGRPTETRGRLERSNCFCAQDTSAVPRFNRTF